MPSYPSRKSSRNASRSDKSLPPLPAKARPGLAVDTSFSRHRGNAPEQVFPNASQAEQSRFANLGDITSLGSKAPTAPKRKGSGEQKVQLDSKCYVPPTTRPKDANRQLPTDNVVLSSSRPSLVPTPLHKRIKGLRPSPLDLTNDVSPSDRAIPIGIAIPSAALSNHEQSPLSRAPYPTSPPRSGNSQRYGQEAATPTIIITPAKDDFEIKSASSDGHGRRPVSSVYSRYTNGVSDTSLPYKRTPPVPPLPRFAARSNASLRVAKRGSAAEQSKISLRGRNGISVCTVFEEQEVDAPKSSPEIDFDKRRSSQYVPTPQRSNGWWNVITSPFSAKSGTFSFRSPPTREEDEDRPILRDASAMGNAEDDEMRSAPPTDRPIQNFSSRTLIRTPKRSGTSPGALDLGNAKDVNIYRVPDEGEAISYYDSNRNFPSVIAPKGLGRPRALEDVGDFDPRDSCYQPPRAIGVAVGDDENSSAAKDAGLRESEFYRIPEDGEAAEYYDSNRTFPSLVPYGFEYGDRGMEEWSPRRSVSQDPSIVGGSLTESPSDIDGADADKEVPSGQAKVVEKSPLQSGHAAEFEGFSAAYGPSERKFFSSPSEDELNGHAPPMPNTTCDTRGIQSPMSDATPIVEDAHTATYMGPHSSNGGLREVEVASSGAPTPMSAAAANGIGEATMASRNAQGVPAYPLMEPMSEKPPYPMTPQHGRTGSQGLGITDDESERGFFPPPGAAAEKTDTSSEYPEELPPRKRRVSRLGFCCCLLPIIFGLSIGALVVLCVFLIPFPHKDVPVQAQWLNLTGFPPLPTGISTVIDPKPVKEVSGCVSHEQLWTCAVPAHDVDMAIPGHFDHPNFRFEVRFRNNTVPANETVPILSNSTALFKRSGGQAAQAGSIVRRATAWTTLLFSSSPAPPSTEDQEFVGQTTDANDAPFNGEETPFYINLLESETLTSNDVPHLQKRDDSFHYPYPSAPASAPASASPSSTIVPTNATSSTVSSTTAASGPTGIPRPAARSDGRPAPAVLYPFAYAQPLRLFNRGQDSEHYGFYTYYDKSLYLSVSSIGNSSNFGGSITPNVILDNANAVCTWSQTRMLVQIWTKKADVTSLSVSNAAKVSVLNSSANDMTAPGSFPYSMTVKLDRHGGDAAEKGVYCYSLDGNQQVTDTVQTWIDENRGFSGELVNPATVPMNNGTSLIKRSGDTGIDGGSGGCECQWQNWE